MQPVREQENIDQLQKREFLGEFQLAFSKLVSNMGKWKVNNCMTLKTITGNTYTESTDLKCLYLKKTSISWHCLFKRPKQVAYNNRTLRNLGAALLYNYYITLISDSSLKVRVRDRSAGSKMNWKVRSGINHSGSTHHTAPFWITGRRKRGKSAKKGGENAHRPAPFWRRKRRKSAKKGGENAPYCSM